MKKNKTSISKARSYKAIGDYWDTHDLSEIWEKTRKVTFDVQVESEVIYYPISRSLSEDLNSIAIKQGVSSDTLINLWIQEKVKEQIS